jgi:heterodisulfide reductase subunit B
LGCTIPARARGYELSARNVAKALGLELVDADFFCCGYPLRSLSAETALLFSAANLAKAEEMGLDICTLCSACTSTLTETAHALHEDTHLLASVNAKLRNMGLSYKGTVKVRHIARVFHQMLEDGLKEKVKKPLSAISAAVHYGCHYLKPSKVYEGFDDPEFPQTIEQILSALSVKNLDYFEKKLCCGGAVLAVDEKLSITLSAKKLACIKEVGADCMVLVCPFCAVMYDDNQRKAEEMEGREFALPVLFLPQILGLALGLDPQKELGFRFNKVKAEPILSKLGGG